MTVESAKHHQRTLYLDDLRGIGAIAVVAVHAIARAIRPLEMTGLAYRFGSALVVAGQWAVPLFVMISGSLFLDPERPSSIHKLLRKTIPRIAAAYLFWSFLYTLLFSTMRYYDGLSAGSIWNTLTGTLKRGSSHLWYLWLLLGLYLLVPILRSCIQNASEALLRYWLIIGFLVSSCAPLMQTIGGFEQIFGEDLGFLNSGFFGGYVLYFVLGYYLKSRDLSKRTRRMLYALGLVGLAVSSGAAFLYPDAGQPTAAGLTSNLSPCVVMTSAALFTACKHSAHERWSSILAPFAVHSFGIYLTHNLFLDSAGLWLVSLLTPKVPALLIACLLILCALVFSVLLSSLVRRIRLISRYII